MKFSKSSVFINIQNWNNTRGQRIAFQKAIRIKPIKIVIGANNLFQKHWIPVEINVLNILKERDWKRYFRPNTIDAILAEHVWEHLTPDEGRQAISLCYKYLKPGGHVRIAVPDGYHPDTFYKNLVKPGGTGPGSDDHKVLYTYTILQKLFISSGFHVRILEYFDTKHIFHYAKWDKKDGFVRRSSRFDPRNKTKKLSYTSLIMDGIK